MSARKAETIDETDLGIWKCQGVSKLSVFKAQPNWSSYLEAVPGMVHGSSTEKTGTLYSCSTRGRSTVDSAWPYTTVLNSSRRLE